MVKRIRREKMSNMTGIHKTLLVQNAFQSPHVWSLKQPHNPPSIEAYGEANDKLKSQKMML